MTNTEKVCDNIIKSGKLDLETMKKGRCVLCSRLSGKKCSILHKQKEQKGE
jgi:hypothetical protein